MTDRHFDSLRALIAAFDRVTQELERNGIERPGRLFIWKYEIDAPEPVRAVSRLLRLVSEGYADVRRVGPGRHSRYRWRPTPAGRVALKAFDRRQRIAAADAALDPAKRQARLLSRLRAKFAGGQPHRFRKLNAELRADLRSILEEMVERGEIRSIGPGWYIARHAVVDPAKPGAALPSNASRIDELLDALAAPRTVNELVAILGKSRQAIEPQLRKFEAQGLVKGPAIVNKTRRKSGRWVRIAPGSGP